LKKLQEDNKRLKKEQTSETDARGMILGLRAENKKLHEKLSKINPGRRTPTYQDDRRQNEEDFETRHQPRIMHSSSYLDRHVASNAHDLDKFKLPDRPNDTTGASRFDHRDLDNGIDHDRNPYFWKRTKSADFFPSREGRNTRYESLQTHEHSCTTPTSTHVQDIMNRYSRKEERFTGSRHRRSASSGHGRVCLF